jgi:hypothetical protein
MDDAAAVMGTDGAADTRTEGNARFAKETSPDPLLEDEALLALAFELPMTEAVAAVEVERAAAILTTGAIAAGRIDEFDDGCGCRGGCGDCEARLEVDAAAAIGTVEATVKATGGSAQPRSSSMSASRQRPVAAATKAKEYKPSPRSLSGAPR